MQSCARCHSAQIVKNGRVQEAQRWLCKACGYSFTRSEPKGAPEAVKRLAVELWRKGLSQKAIGQIVGYSNVSVSNWIDQASKKLPEPALPQEVQVVEVDELHHFVGKKSKNAGYGLLWMAFPDNCSTGSLVLVVPGRSALSLNA